MKIYDLIPQIRAGFRPVVTFRKGIEDKDDYAEPGMRARLIDCGVVRDDVVVFTFDFGEFDADNKAFEKANYYDAKGVACLTPREANAYKPIDTIYFDLDEEVDGLFAIGSDAELALFAEYVSATARGVTYVEWLTSEVLRLRGTETPVPGAAVDRTAAPRA